MEDLIKNTIKSYLENRSEIYDIINEEEIDEDFFYNLIEAIDPDNLSEKICDAIKERIFTFQTSEYANQVCTACGDRFGDFMSSYGEKVPKSDVIKDGKSIIII